MLGAMLGGHPEAICPPEAQFIIDDSDARLLAVCDTLEALSHPRPYRDGLSPRDALGRIRVLGRYTLDGDIVDTLADELDVLLEDEFLSSRTA